jgi:hypothetical protein
MGIALRKIKRELRIPWAYSGINAALAAPAGGVREINALNNG